MQSSDKNIVNKNHALMKLIEGAERVEVKEVSVAKDTSDSSGKERAFMVRIHSSGESRVITTKKPATPSKAPRDRSHLLKCAEVLLQNKDYLLARNIYSQLLTENIKDDQGLKGLGICLFYLGDRPSARKCFKALWEIHKKEDALIWIGRCYAEEGDDDSAARVFDKVSPYAQLDEQDRFSYLKEVGNCHLRLGNYDQANSAYQRAKAIQPNSDAVAVNLGMLEFHCGRLSNARAHFTRALKLNHRASKAYSGLGIVAMAEKNYSAAEKRFNEALDVDPLNQVAVLQLVILAYQTNSFELVEPRLERFLGKEPENIAVLYAYAGVLFKRSQWRKCELTLEKILKIAPTHEKAKSLRESLSKIIDQSL